VRAELGGLLQRAASRRTAILAFNVYTVDQAAGVIDGAGRAEEPVILQVHPGGTRDLLIPLIAALCVLRDAAPIPIAIQLDHTTDLAIVAAAATAGSDGVMVDGSGSRPADNAALVRGAREAIGPSVWLEGELGRMSGSEDGSDQPAGELTDPDGVATFIEASRVDALAVSVGNVHGSTVRPPTLDIDRLRAIDSVSSVPLVLHGASGLSESHLRAAIAAGIRKININTEIRTVYRAALRGADPELATVLQAGRREVAHATEQMIVRIRD
jgi:tagatose 1,6-diphosphate aldolase GatY/KbaY